MTNTELLFPTNTLLAHEQRKEQARRPVGVILVPMYFDRASRQTHLYLVDHKENREKGIAAGDLGLPSETTEEDEAVEETFRRLLAQECGLGNLGNSRLYIQPEFSYLHYRLPSQNGLDVNTPVFASLLCTWLEKPLASLSDPTLLDRSEVRNIISVPSNKILYNGMGFSFRRYPPSKRIIEQLASMGIFIPDRRLVKLSRFEQLQHLEARMQTIGI